MLAFASLKAQITELKEITDWASSQQNITLCQLPEGLKVPYMYQRPHASRAYALKWRFIWLGIEIMLATASVKHLITGLKEINDLSRRMGPPVNKISHHSLYLEARS